MTLERYKLFGLLVLFVIGAADGVRAATQEQIYRILGEHGIPFDRETAARCAIRGLLTAVDEGARIIAVDQDVPVVTNRTLDTAEEWPEGICYVRLNGLYEGGGAESVRLFKAWAQTGRTGMIVDIRGANGDDIASVDDIGGMFGATNSLLYTVRSGRGDVLESHRVKKAIPLGATPLMLLVDGDTAGACELLAATLKGRKGVMLVGSRTKGDARIRENIRLSDNEILYISTKWLIPAGEVEYDQVGIKPDITVSPLAAGRKSVPSVKRIGKRPSKKEKVDRKLMERVAGDAVLARATDILLGLKALRRTGQQTGAEAGGPASRVPNGW
jgi:C-terminal processing protease CtpA/Prc